MAKTGASARTHVVLIPGFGGFDALGQLEYYAGLTPVFCRWRGRKNRPDVVLHYFDNFPTAAVVTRAGRLERYLAKRIARGQIQAGDPITLIGHSTGGLDIRRLLWKLAGSPGTTVSVDGGERLKAGDLLGHIRRVVFLSVPQWGTNIADWVRAHAAARTLVVAELRAAVCGSQVPIVDTLEDWATRLAACLSGADLLSAVEDALTEAELPCGNRDPTRTAGAHEAASQLSLWLRHMAWDFSAIDDLSSQAPAGDVQSPAHFNDRLRRREIDSWKSQGIETRSYATLSRRPFRFEAGRPAPVWDLLAPLEYPEISKDDTLAVGTDAFYRFCYRACAGGPFDRAAPEGTQPAIELWDNDGIVNTASMFWPDGEKTVLIEADHMDIVGHHRLVKAPPGGGRKYQAYDLLGSCSGFDDGDFKQVWSDVFDFCAG